MQFIDLQTQLAHIRPAIDRRIKKVLDHGQFIMGPEVFELEQLLADYVGVEHCISCANGTDALQIALMALGVGQDDIVFTSAFSFFASAEVIPQVGATPYFCDIEPATYNLCPSSLERAIQAAISRGQGTPKAVIAVDMFGLPADYPAIQAICDKYGLHLIEDGAQSFGGSITENTSKQKCGSFGDIATTSFFPAKPLGCYGDGGALFTNSVQLAELARSIRFHGKGGHKYDNVRIGLNSRLDTLQAAILLEKLQHFENELSARQEVANNYQQRLGRDFVVPVVAEGYISAWAQFTLQGKSKTREDWIAALTEQNIPSAVYYPKALNAQQPLQHYPSTSTPNTQSACDGVFSLPMHGYLTAAQIQQITRPLVQVIKQSH